MSMKTRGQPIMQKRTEVRRLADGCVIKLACGHEYGAMPVSGTIDELVAILSRHIDKVQRCYKCEEEKGQVWKNKDFITQQCE